MSDLSNRGVLYRGYKKVRVTLERVPAFRSAIDQAVELKNTLLDGRKAEGAALDQLFESYDPYGFERPEEAIRFQRALEMLNGVRGTRQFDRAFEIGCAEGKFTSMLAPMCGELLAADISPRAVERARATAGKLPNVSLSVWNMRFEPVPGKFDLIVAVGVVEYIHNPAKIRQVRDALLGALNPGGYFLIGTTVSPTEHTWLGRRLLRGTLINRFFEAHPDVERCAVSLDECALPFEHSLLRKVR